MRRSIRRATTIVTNMTTPTTIRRCQKGMGLYSTAGSPSFARLHAIAQMRSLLERLLRHEKRPVVRRHDVAGVRKGTVPTHVVDVQVCVHDEIDLGRARADPRKLGKKSRAGSRHEGPRLRAEP